jgi:hypothetical protein
MAIISCPSRAHAYSDDGMSSRIKTRASLRDNGLPRSWNIVRIGIVRDFDSIAVYDPDTWPVKVSARLVSLRSRVLTKKLLYNL